jgi:hypothetical protein
VRDWSGEEFMTVAEVAALLKLNQQTIRNWIQCGIPHQIHYVDFGVMRTRAAKQLAKAGSATAEVGITRDGRWRLSASSSLQKAPAAAARPWRR